MVSASPTCSTYLSPQEYKGIDFRISRESMRMTRFIEDGNVSLQTFFPADLGYTHNKVDNNNTFFSNWPTGTTACIIIFRSRAISNCLPEESATSTVALSIICATETTPPKHVPISTLPHREWLFGTCASRPLSHHTTLSVNLPLAGIMFHAQLWTVLLRDIYVRTLGRSSELHLPAQPALSDKC